MDRNQIEQLARTHMLERKDHAAREPGWLFYHGLRTAGIAEELCRFMKMDIDRDVLFAGALFHDIGKGSEQHSVKGAEITRSLLVDHCSGEDLARICEIVQLHNQRNGSAGHSPEVRVVQDADLLDHVGPMGPWLAFYWSGTHGENIQDHLGFMTGEENARHRSRMREGLNFAASVALYDERVRWEDGFFETFRKVYFEGVWHKP
jgi:uncharacterized protein